MHLIPRDVQKYIMDKPETTLDSYVVKAPEKGLWLEFGVYSGRTISNLASKTTKPVFGFDSWQGLPEPWLNDCGLPRFKKGDFATVKPKDLPDNVVLISGWFADTVPKFCELIDEPISLIHIDCDLYSSTKTIFNNFKDRFQDGTILLFDEFINYDGWEFHEFKAFREFVEETGHKWDTLGRYGKCEVGVILYK